MIIISSRLWCVKVCFYCEFSVLHTRLLVCWKSYIKNGVDLCVCVCCVYVFWLPSARRYCGEVGLLRPMESGRNGGRGCFFLPKVPGLSKSWTLFRNFGLHISIRFLVPLSCSPLLACRLKQLPSSAIGYGAAAGRIWRQFRNCFHFFTESMVLSFFWSFWNRSAVPFLVCNFYDFLLAIHHLLIQVEYNPDHFAYKLLPIRLLSRSHQETAISISHCNILRIVCERWWMESIIVPMYSTNCME